MTTETREYTDDMGEISGFGGGYEAACRAMVLAGLKWLDEHPQADPKFHGFKGVYGICMEDNEDAKQLSAAIVEASGNDCTGAMHQAAVSHILFIRKNGWAKYVDEMRKPARGGRRDGAAMSTERRKKMIEMKWEYDVTCPMLPPGATSPVMDYGQMTDWLNQRAEQGWEFVSYAQTRWNNGTVQEWWIFRRPRRGLGAPHRAPRAE